MRLQDTAETSPSSNAWCLAEPTGGLAMNSNLLGQTKSLPTV